ncbi:MAG: hypothetical protein ACTSQP_21250 [Promethearchaeota archaeon]
MNIQVVSFALVPQHIYIATKYFHTEKLILILSDEKVEDKAKREELKIKMDEIIDFCKKLGIQLLKIRINYKDFIQMTLKLVKLISEFTEKDNILLNLSGGRRAIPIALIYASTFVNIIKNLRIQCVVIPEDGTFSPFNLIPSYFPDKIDVKLMSMITKGLTLTAMESDLGIKQPTISFRLKRLEKYGYLKIDGRKRDLTDLGMIITQILRPNSSKF